MLSYAKEVGRQIAGLAQGMPPTHDGDKERLEGILGLIVELQSSRQDGQQIIRIPVPYQLDRGRVVPGRSRSYRGVG